METEFMKEFFKTRCRLFGRK